MGGHGRRGVGQGGSSRPNFHYPFRPLLALDRYNASLETEGKKWKTGKVREVRKKATQKNALSQLLHSRGLARENAVPWEEEEPEESVHQIVHPVSGHLEKGHE